jgi:hypothetical protein
VDRDSGVGVLMKGGAVKGHPNAGEKTSGAAVAATASTGVGSKWVVAHGSMRSAQTATSKRDAVVYNSDHAN